MTDSYGIVERPPPERAIAAALCVIASGLLDAQSTFATLRGTVRDPSRTVVANAGIAVKDAATGALRSNLTDTAGIYSVVDLYPAVYEITVSATGFATRRRPYFELTVSSEVILNITLSPSTLNSSIDVTAGCGRS